MFRGRTNAEMSSMRQVSSSLHVQEEQREGVIDMAQRFCEICSDPLALDSTDTICESCQTTINMQVETMELEERTEERECETPAPVVEQSSSETLNETSPEVVESMSESFGALDAIAGSESESPASPSQTDQTEQSVESQTEKPNLLACDTCGKLQKDLKKFKHPMAGAALDLCESCFDAEKAAIEKPDDPMQGKLVHPDEANREEIISMDNEDRILYNDEVRISIESPIEEVYARINLLENRLQRAKLQLKASRTTLFMRIEHMKKDEREAEYKRLNERDAVRRRAKSPVGVGADGEAVARKTAARPRRTKAEAFRDSMRNNGFDDVWIDAQIKKMGLE